MLEQRTNNLPKVVVGGLIFQNKKILICQRKEEGDHPLKWEFPGGKLKDNEKKVLQAIKILFETVDEIEIFNKKAIYLYIREITGLNTKQVVNNLNKIRIKYRNFKKGWNEGKL